MAAALTAETGEILTRPSAVTLWADDGATRSLGGWAHRAVLPAVADEDMSAARGWLGWWLSRPSATLWRYAVVTGGQRVRVEGLREAIRSLQSRVSAWLRKTAEIEAAVTILEVTIVHEADGQYTYHPHVNVVYRPTKKMSREQWVDFLAASWDRLGAHWHDAGKVRDIREICKYITKVESSDTSPAHAAVEVGVAVDRVARREARRVVGLLDLPGGELAALADALHRVHRVRWRGGLAAARRACQARGERPRWTGTEWRLVRTPRARRGDDDRQREPWSGRPILVAPSVAALASPTPRRAWVVLGDPADLSPEDQAAAWRAWDRAAERGEGQPPYGSHMHEIFADRDASATVRDPSRGPPPPPATPPARLEAARRWRVEMEEAEEWACRARRLREELRSLPPRARYRRARLQECVREALAQSRAARRQARGWWALAHPHLARRAGVPVPRWEDLEPPPPPAEAEGLLAEVPW